MTENQNTPFSTKCEILAELWMNYRYDKDMQDFFEYNDIGFPLAYALKEEIVLPTPMAEKFVEETFALLLSSVELEDTGWENLDQIFDNSTTED